MTMVWAMASVTPLIDWAVVFADARRVSGLTQAEVAKLMEISEPLLSAQLKKTGHVSLFRLALAATKATEQDERPKVFVRVVLARMAEELGLGECDPMAAAVGQALSVLGTVVGQMQFRMSRAAVQVVQQKRSA